MTSNNLNLNLHSIGDTSILWTLTLVPRVSPEQKLHFMKLLVIDRRYPSMWGRDIDY